MCCSSGEYGNGAGFLAPRALDELASFVVLYFVCIARMGSLVCIGRSLVGVALYVHTFCDFGLAQGLRYTYEHPYDSSFKSYRLDVWLHTEMLFSSVSQS